MRITNEKNQKTDKKIDSTIASIEKKPTTSHIKKSFFKFNKKNNKAKKTTISKAVSKDLDEFLKVNPYAQLCEYYDLPYRYNQTVIKILAQTPHSIFIYWDIADSDRNTMIEKYGEKFFNETIPILLIHNQTQNCSFEIEIDDFTNSWYLRTPTSNCVFNIELGRKPKASAPISIDSEDHILHITKSNTIESPNDHMLNYNNIIYFKNIKTNKLEEKNISELNPIEGIYDLYNDEFVNNPSSDFRI